MSHIPTQEAQAVAIDYSTIYHKAGVYSLAAAADASDAATIGIQLALVSYPGQKSPNAIAMTNKNIRYLDSYAKTVLYAAECPHKVLAHARISQKMRKTNSHKK